MYFCFHLEEILIETDIFGQHCYLSSKRNSCFWEPTRFHVPDRIFQELNHNLLFGNIHQDSILLCLFPLHLDIDQSLESNQKRGLEEISLPSTVPQTPYELLQLQQRFHLMLYNESALEIGLCRKRRRLYDDIFDEMIRLVTIECAERGLLLARVKNEYVRLMKTYEEIYTSSMAYALRQYLKKTAEQNEIKNQIRQIQLECQELRHQIETESVRLEKSKQLLAIHQTEDDIDDEYRTQRQIMAKKNVVILRSTNEILRQDVQSALSTILQSSIFTGEPINYDEEKQIKQ